MRRILARNLEVDTVQQRGDETSLEPVETFILGRMASSAAETYVLGCFQLYVTLYLDKATRGVEAAATISMPTYWRPSASRRRRLGRASR